MEISGLLLAVNPFSRPARKLTGVKGIVIHWTGNPNTTAIANRNYFDSLKSGDKGTYASAHYIICFDGSIIQCIPDDEIAYHVGSQTYTEAALSKLSSYPNNCTIGVECVVTDMEGTMTQETYDALVQFCAEKMMELGLTVDDLWLHKEVVGWKDCHRWFVNHPEEWIQFKNKVSEKMQSSTESVVIMSPSTEPVEILSPENEEVEILKLELWQWKMIGDALDGMYKKGLISDYTWAEKAYKQELTQSELLFINSVVISRQLGIEL